MARSDATRIAQVQPAGRHKSGDVRPAGHAPAQPIRPGRGTPNSARERRTWQARHLSFRMVARATTGTPAKLAFRVARRGVGEGPGPTALMLSTAPQPGSASRAGSGPLERDGRPGYCSILDMHRSPVSRSVGVLMTALVAFQLALTASGVACIMPRDAMPTVAQGSATMRTGAPMAASTRVIGESTRRIDPATRGMPERAPCNQEMRWPACLAMGPCIVALAPAPIGARPLPPGLPACLAALVVIAPPSRTYPPDLPPPRA